MIDFIFAICVMLLEWGAGILGLSYQAINVWFFCVLWPLFTVWLIWLVLKQRKKIKSLLNENRDVNIRLAKYRNPNVGQ